MEEKQLIQTEVSRRAFWRVNLPERELFTLPLAEVLQQLPTVANRSTVSAVSTGCPAPSQAPPHRTPAPFLFSLKASHVPLPLYGVHAALSRAVEMLLFPALLSPGVGQGSGLTGLLLRHLSSNRLLLVSELVHKWDVGFRKLICRNCVREWS